jgi:hypothetical protein
MRSIKINTLKEIKRNFILVTIISIILIAFIFTTMHPFKSTNPNIQISVMIYSFIACMGVMIFSTLQWSLKLNDYINVCLIFLLFLMFIPFNLIVLLSNITYIIFKISIFNIILFLSGLITVYINIKIIIGCLNFIKDTFNKEKVKLVLDFFGKLFNILSLFMVLISSVISLSDYEVNSTIYFYTLIITLETIFINLLLLLISYWRYIKQIFIDVFNCLRDK